MDTMDIKNYKPKTFWKRPEGTTGMIFLLALLVGGGILLYNILPFLITLASNVLYLGLLILGIAALAYMVFDPKMRNLVWYGYKSVMRGITSMFVQIDPIGILKSYVDDLRNNLKNMNKQIGSLRGQMHRLNEVIRNNQKQIESNLLLANRAKEHNKDGIMILKSRKAGRLQDSNIRLEDLYKKMEILYRVLVKMYENAEILLEDVQDQVAVKEQERKAIRASHSAMRSAMNIISGNSDRREMFDMALEAIAEDVSQKVGEMERFMDMSQNFMSSIDLQNGVFEEEGLKMLEDWEREGVSRLLGGEKQSLLAAAKDDTQTLDLEKPMPQPVKAHRNKNPYDSFFEREA